MINRENKNSINMKLLGYANDISACGYDNMSEEDIEDIKRYLPGKVYQTDVKAEVDDTYLLSFKGMCYYFQFIHEDFLDIVITNLDAI